MEQPVAYLSTNLVEVKGVRLASTGELVDNAQVDITVKTPGGVEVEGVAWPIRAEPKEGEPGSYLGVIPPEAELTERAFYVLWARIDAGSNLVRTMRVRCFVS